MVSEGVLRVIRSSSDGSTGAELLTVFYNTLSMRHQGVRKNAARVVDQDVSPSVDNAIIILLAGCSKGYRCVPKEAVTHQSQPMSVLRRSLGRQICSSERSPLPVDPCVYRTELSLFLQEIGC